MILLLSILVSGYLRFRIWDFLLCGAASFFLSDAARLGVLDLSGSRINGTPGVRGINGTGRKLVTKDRLVRVWGL